MLSLPTFLLLVPPDAVPDAGDEWCAGADTWTVRPASTRELDAVTDATRIRDHRSDTDL